MTTTTITRRTITLFGGPVHLVLRPAESGYTCTMAGDRHRADMRDDIAGAWGHGEDIPAAMRSFVASCHRREAEPYGGTAP